MPNINVALVLWNSGLIWRKLDEAKKEYYLRPGDLQKLAIYLDKQWSKQAKEVEYEGWRLREPN